MSDDKKIQFKVFHAKSPLFRVFAADGAWGALNSNKTIHLSFYTERPALPTAANYEYQNGKLTDMKTENGGQTQRDFEADIALNVEAARQVHAVLGNFIKLADGKPIDETK